MNSRIEALKSCRICPRNCGVDRLAGKIGVCGQSEELVLARAALHMWEEPCISGTAGSGTVFFSGCSMHCVFCQNEGIANGTVGKSVSAERLIEIFLELQEKGANNINLVTADHYVPVVAWALKQAKQQGLLIPIVYNTGSYLHVDTVKMLEGLVDVYLPDFKYYDSKIAARYAKAPEYASVAKAAIAEMVRQTGEPVFYEKETGRVLAADKYNDYEGDKEVLIKRGTIVRHLLLPGCEEDSKHIIKYLIDTYGESIYISLLNQYTTMKHFEKYSELNRRITEEEYEAMIEYAIECGIENGFIQEGDTAKESFIPDFDYSGL